MPALIDTHQHLIYPDAAGYGWTDDIPPLAGQAFTLQDYQDLTAGADILGTIFMEAGVDDADYQNETRFISKLAGEADSGILGLIASCRPETDAGFGDWLDECADLNVVGFRRILHVVDDDMSKSSAFRRNIRMIGDRGKVFDMCFLARQHAIALELARACDNTALVLDHCGVPDIAGDGLEPWRKGMSALAALPYVTCKLSGILAYCTPGSASLAAIRPYVDHVFETFGPERIIWGSDWPVVNLGGGLPGWIEMTQEILGGLSDAEAQSVGTKNAMRVYGITAP
jgi:predicted TIM-barrel fold metal-dependent hydrolase